MNDRLALEKAIKYLRKLLKSDIHKTITETQEIKETMEYLNGMMYQCK